MSWQNAPSLMKLTAAQHGGKRGAHLWGVDVKGMVHSIYQKTPGGEWSNWMGPDWAGPGFPKQVYELAATQGKDGRVTLFTLDVKRNLHCITQDDPDGDWTGWQVLDWNGAPLRTALGHHHDGQADEHRADRTCLQLAATLVRP